MAKEVQIKAYKCEKCGKIWGGKYVAKTCCKEYHCDTCGVKTRQYWTRCNRCSEKNDFDKAKKITEKEWANGDYPSGVFFEDGYYWDIADVVDEYPDAEYVYALIPLTLAIDSDLLTNFEEDASLDEIVFEDEAYKMFDEFCKEFNKKHSVDYFMQDDNTIVLLDKAVE